MNSRSGIADLGLRNKGADAGLGTRQRIASTILDFVIAIILGAKSPERVLTLPAVNSEIATGNVGILE
jgi:hypothetical protein